MSYAQALYDRNFREQEKVKERLDHLLPKFRVSHTIMSEQKRNQLLTCAYHLRDGSRAEADTLRDYFSSLDIELDIYSLDAFVRYRMNRSSKFFVKHLSDMSPNRADYVTSVMYVQLLLKKEKLSYTERPTQGIFRKVFHFEEYVIKYEYMLGQQENEIGLWFNKPHKVLCPIDYVSEDGHFIVMPKCGRVNDVEPIAEKLGFDPEGDGLTLDNGARIWELAEETNWGTLNGEHVIVDYGASTF